MAGRREQAGWQQQQQHVEHTHMRLGIVFLCLLGLNPYHAAPLSLPDAADPSVGAASITDTTYAAIHRYATYAALTYCAKSDSIAVGNLQKACPIVLCSGSSGNVQVEHVYRGTVSGVLFRDDDHREIVVALKGTTSDEEWLMDFKIYPMPYHFLSKRKKGWRKYFSFDSDCRGCTVHKGFYDGSKEIYDNMFAQIAELAHAYPDYSLVVTGHSLGGAIAPIIANELLFLPADRTITVISFGSPKIGNKLFAKWVDEAWNTRYHYDNLHSGLHKSAYIRVSHKDDVVPLLPVKQLGFYHCGIDLYFNTNSIPMLQEHVQVRDTPSHLLSDASVNGSAIHINRGNAGKLFDSHRVYLLRMSQCSQK